VADVLDRDARAFLGEHRVAHLATADRDGEPHVVPLCYALAGDAIYFVIDGKPKRRGGLGIKRMRNIAENPNVALIVDDYDEDWGALKYLLIRGRAAVVTDDGERTEALVLLRAKYPQYRAMELVGDDYPVVRITPAHIHFWRARP
jgi:PPOX class probable F420-dependent enzyme